MRELSDKETNDGEYLDLVLVDVEGLADENGTAIKGDAALDEVRIGGWSTFCRTPSCRPISSSTATPA